LDFASREASEPILAVANDAKNLNRGAWMETFGSGPYVATGRVHPRAQFLAMTADLPIFVTFGPVEIRFAITQE
jgi:hypothetical protein